MKLHLSGIRFMLAIAGIAAIAILGRTPNTNADSNSLPNPYHQVEGWGKNLPNGRTWGSTNSVAIDSKGNVWFAERCGGASCADSNLDPILEFDSSGKFIKSFGAGLIVVPHGVYIDKAGDVWATDNSGKGQKGQQVIKFSPDGRVLMTLGKAGVAGDGPDTFNQPNAVIVAANGDIFVADGHTASTGNARIVKFSKDGKFIKQWGTHGSGPGQFEVPHALALDSKGRLFVADRVNKRIQIFDQDGKFLEEWKQFGTPSGLFIDQHDQLYVADSVSQTSDAKAAASYNPGFEQGIRIGSAKTGKVSAFIPIPPPAGVPTNAPEGVAADSTGAVYAADIALKGPRKYVKQ